MSQLFDKIKVGTSKRSTFDLSHHQVTTSDFGYIIPICYRDMVPNDEFVVSPQIFCRLAPMAAPTYGSIKCHINHFFVPYRILYPHWDSFLLQDPSNHTVPPYYLVGTLRQALNSDPAYGGDSPILSRNIYGRLMSNLGLNPALILDSSVLPADERIAAFPFLAYYRLWLDYFCDTSINDHPSLVAAFNDRIKDGGSLAVYTTYLETQNCCFKKDYFTTAKLHPQDGDPSRVAVDIASSSLNPGLNYTGSQITPSLRRDADSNVGLVDAFNNPLPSSSNSILGQFTVEALRAANSLQRYLERNNFVGTKIINRILAHFGISPTPERLDMAEWIGGSSFPIRIGDVTKTSNNNVIGITSIGSQAGKGIGAHQGQSVRYHAKEHGIFMSVMTIVPDTGYYQGINRFWNKGVYGDALDYYTPEFENLGYQELLNKEVFVPYIGATYQEYDPDGIFGYQPRYAEYKFQQDVLGGDFVTVDTSRGEPMFTPEDSFHLFRHLNFDGTYPLALNNNFVAIDNHNNDYDRIFQITDTDVDHFYFNIDVDVKATRPMTGFTEPTLDSANSGDGNTINLPYGGTRL